jgi:hypothetical protein
LYVKVNDLSVYPNPANAVFNVRTELSTPQTIEISNAIGQLVYTSKFVSNTTVNCNNWPEGLYFVKCNNSTKKIIISN